MRKLPLYIFTEDLNFFYRVKKSLDDKRLRLRVLPIRNKLPRTSSIVITTVNEIENIGFASETNIIIPYSKKYKFEHYIFKIIAAYRAGYKESYSELLFSIDPGEKRIGIAVFLDGYYLESKCCFTPQELFKKIEFYIDYFRIYNSASIRIVFKFGIGILAIAHDLIVELFTVLKNENEKLVYLINEFKSSKIRVDLKGRDEKISKDEISAVILAFRHGIRVDEETFSKVFDHLKSNGSRLDDSLLDFELISENIEKFGELTENVLKGLNSLSEVSEMVERLKSTNDNT